MTNKVDLDYLASLTSGVNLSQVPPIHQKRLLTFVNHFIIVTVEFLKRFAQICERKLMDCGERIQKLEADLRILEAKLNSIPGLEDEIKENVAPVPATEGEKGKPSNNVDASASQEPTEQQTDETFAPESDSSSPPAAKNPELIKFFKMVQFGVPVPAVKLKMQQEGFDPNLLDS